MYWKIKTTDIPPSMRDVMDDYQPKTAGEPMTYDFLGFDVLLPPGTEYRMKEGLPEKRRNDSVIGGKINTDVVQVKPSAYQPTRGVKDFWAITSHRSLDMSTVIYDFCNFLTINGLSDRYRINLVFLDPAHLRGRKFGVFFDNSHPCVDRIISAPLVTSDNGSDILAQWYSYFVSDFNKSASLAYRKRTLDGFRKGPILNQHGKAILDENDEIVFHDQHPPTQEEVISHIRNSLNWNWFMINDDQGRVQSINYAYSEGAGLASPPYTDKTRPAKVKWSRHTHVAALYHEVIRLEGLDKDQVEYLDNPERFRSIHYHKDSLDYEYERMQWLVHVRNDLVSVTMGGMSVPSSVRTANRMNEFVAETGVLMRRVAIARLKCGPICIGPIELDEEE